MSAAAAEEPAVPGALRLPHPLQHIPAPGEEKLLAALLRPLDGTGVYFSFFVFFLHVLYPVFSRLMG